MVIVEVELHVLGNDRGEVRDTAVVAPSELLAAMVEPQVHADLGECAITGLIAHSEFERTEHAAHRPH